MILRIAGPVNRIVAGGRIAALRTGLIRVRKAGIGRCLSALAITAGRNGCSRKATVLGRILRLGQHCHGALRASGRASQNHAPRGAIHLRSPLTNRPDAMLNVIQFIVIQLMISYIAPEGEGFVGCHRHRR